MTSEIEWRDEELLPGERGTPFRRRAVMVALGVHFSLWWAFAVVLWARGDESWEAALAAPLAPILWALESDGSILLFGAVAAALLVATIAHSLHRPRAWAVGRAHAVVALWWLLSLTHLAG